jgi:hypothetical protein
MTMTPEEARELFDRVHRERTKSMNIIQASEGAEICLSAIAAIQAASAMLSQSPAPTGEKT